MQVLIRIIIPALIPIILGILLSNIDKSNSKEIIKNLTKEHIVIRLPKAYIWVGCVEMSFTATCFAMMHFLQPDLFFELLWITMFALGFIIVEVSFVWKIEIFRSENYFLCRTLHFKTHKTLYSDCVNYRFGANTLVLRTKERTFHIDTHATNFEFLLAMLTQYEITEIK